MDNYIVVFFETPTHKPAQNFLYSLSERTISKSLRMFDFIRRYGLEIGMPYVKRIHLNLWEIRIRGKEQIRYLCTRKMDHIIILHGFKKKRQKIHPKEIETALNRLTNI